MPKKNRKKNKKSVVDIRMDDHKVDEIKINDDGRRNYQVVSSIQMITLPKADYDKLYNEYTELKKLNTELNKELLRITNDDLKRLIIDNEKLFKENINLNLEIDRLKKENIELREIIIKHEKTINALDVKVQDLTDRLNKKELEENKRLEKFISAEICIEYEQSILRNIFMKDDLKDNKYTLNKLINLTIKGKINEIKLTSTQTDKWNKYYKHLEDNKLVNIHTYLKNIKNGRNKSAHECYKPSEYTKEEAEKYIISYIESFDEDNETKNKYKRVVNFLISKINKKFKKGKRSMKVD